MHSANKTMPLPSNKNNNLALIFYKFLVFYFRTKIFYLNSARLLAKDTVSQHFRSLSKNYQWMSRISLASLQKSLNRLKTPTMYWTRTELMN